jgi:hypothetical protein
MVESNRLANNMQLEKESFFVSRMKERAKLLIRCQIWRGLDEERFNAWFKQFEDRDCAILGGCLVDALIFRDRAQLEALLKSAFTSCDLLGKEGVSDNALLDVLKRRHPDPRIRLVPVIRFDQPPTKSGNYVLRRIAKSLGIQDRWMVWPQSLSGEVGGLHTIILVDDFCGSGTQFRKFVEDSTFQSALERHKSCRVVFVAAACHSEGINYIEDNFPKIEVIAGETIGPEHSFFDGFLASRDEGEALKSKVRSQYDAIAAEVKLGGSLGYYGYEGQALTYAFDHGTPNNTLPIYWFENERWTALVER